MKIIKTIVAALLFSSLQLAIYPPNAHALENCNLTQPVDDTYGCSMDFSGQDLHGKVIDRGDLFHANFTGADLSGTRWSGLILYNVNFTGANLSGANFYTANIHYVNFYETNLDKVNFFGVSIGMVTSGGITGQPNNLPQAPGYTGGFRIQNGFFLGPNTCITGDISMLDLSGITTLPKTCGSYGKPKNMPPSWRFVNGIFLDEHRKGIDNTEKCDLSGGDLSNFVSDAYLVQCDFSGTDLDGADLSGAQIWGSTSGGITGVPNHLPSLYSLDNGYLVGPAANLESADLAGVNLSYRDLTGANLNFADLRGATLTGSNLDSASLTFTKLSNVSSGGIRGSLAGLSPDWVLKKGLLIGPGANLVGEDLRDIDLTGSNLTGANLSDSNLENQDLSGSTLEGVNFAGANLQGIRGNDLIGQPSVIPLGWAYITNHFVGRGAHLNNLYLGGSFDGIDLTGSDLSGAHIGGTFSGANLSNCNINEADFSNTDLSGVIGENIQGRPTALPRLWNLVDGKFLRMFELQRLPALEGEFKVGKTAKIELGIWSDSPTLSISWFRDGVLLPSQHSTAIEITSDDVGHKFSAVIKATKTGFEDKTVTTTESSKVVKAMFTGSVTPKINGIAKVGKTLTVSSKAWAVGALQKFQWMLDGKAIKGLVSSKIAVSTKYKGHKLSVSVTQSLPGYVPLTKYSSSIKIG